MIDIEKIRHKAQCIIEKKCPNCGAPLKSNTCDYCGSEFMGVEKEEKKRPVSDCNFTCTSTCTSVCSGTCTGTCAGGCTGMSEGKTSPAPD